MSTNLFGIGLSGLSAAQSGLSTTGNNISNVNTPGYNRESMQLTEAIGGKTGNGVKIQGVQRNYAQFLTRQLNQAQSTESATSTNLDQVNQIDNLLSDSSSGVAPDMQTFFNGLQTLAGTPEDASARNAVLGDAQNLASDFRSFGTTLSNMSTSVNQQVDSAVKQVNNYASQIAGLNKQIIKTQARTGNAPNGLLDQRDELVAKTQQLINVNVTQGSDGSYNMTVGGQSLVDATGSHQLATMSDPQDPTQQVLAYKNVDGSLRQISPQRVTGGTIGGLLAFQTQTLAPTQQKLNQTAHDFAAAVNAQHEQGTDLNGNPGQAMFTTSQPKAYGAQTNTGSASLSVSFASGQTQSITDSNYRVSYDGSQYNVTRLSDGKTVDTSTSSSLSFDGLNVAVSGTANKGDSFIVRPLDNSASNMQVAISDPAQIAAAQGSAPGDNRNANALANLQQASIVEGNRSLSDNYGQLVDNVGNAAQSLQVNDTTQKSLTNELTQAQQSVSGVNLNEEDVNLMYYQQMYQANAAVIKTANTVFNTVLGLGQ